MASTSFHISTAQLVALIFSDISIGLIWLGSCLLLLKPLKTPDVEEAELYSVSFTTNDNSLVSPEFQIN